MDEAATARIGYSQHSFGRPCSTKHKVMITTLVQRILETTRYNHFTTFYKVIEVMYTVISVIKTKVLENRN